MKRQKRLRDLKRTAKDFPRYRELIEVHGWIPRLLCDTDGAYWDGLTAIDSKGEVFTGLSDPGRKQMINMILDGYFGEALKDILLDQDRYMKIQDDLLDFPNVDVIAKEALRVLPVVRKA